MKHNQVVAVLDFGSQYTQLIARRVREQNVYSEILPFDTDIEFLRDAQIKGVILSGGPSSVYAKKSPQIDWKIKNVIAGPDVTAPVGSKKKSSNPINPDLLAPNIKP